MWWIALAAFGLVHGILFAKALSSDENGYKWLLADLAFVTSAIVVGGVIEATT